jgi:hypothetical protein
MATRVDFPFPFRLASSGHLASPAYTDHVDEMVRQVLFTAPGERVMRATFGTGLQRLIFASVGPEQVATLQVMVQAALTRSLAGVIAVESVSTAAEDSRVTVTIVYTVLATGERRSRIYR